MLQEVIKALDPSSFLSYHLYDVTEPLVHGYGMETSSLHYRQNWAYGHPCQEICRRKCFNSFILNKIRELIMRKRGE